MLLADELSRAPTLEQQDEIINLVNKKIHELEPALAPGFISKGEKLLEYIMRKLKGHLAWVTKDKTTVLEAEVVSTKLRFGKHLTAETQYEDFADEYKISSTALEQLISMLREFLSNDT